jgi:hypothetical protein
LSLDNGVLVDDSKDLRMLAQPGLFGRKIGRAGSRAQRPDRAATTREILQ